MTPHANLKHAAFDFVDDLQRITTAEAVVATMTRAFASFGYEFFCVTTFPRPQQRFEEVILASRLPAEWIKIYLEERYVHDDPTIRHCKRVVYPFAWKDAPHDPEREPRAAELIQRAGDFGLANGLWVPIPSPTGCEGGVWLGGPHCDLTARSSPAIHLMALYAFERIRSLLALPEIPRPCLTVREREVLTWVAQGKSAWEIGEILNIAKRTVDEHVQTAGRKLGASNRTQAVALALRHRVLEA
jgi:LuxR family quorum sensing-dependent transcriptional regulator